MLKCKVCGRKFRCRRLINVLKKHDLGNLVVSPHACVEKKYDACKLGNLVVHERTCMWVVYCVTVRFSWLLISYIF